jgi:hypothetical protein
MKHRAMHGNDWPSAEYEPRSQFAGENAVDLWAHQAAAEARRWRRRYADEDIPPLLMQAIRLDRFTVRRG